ncbi:MAG: hypothetical protein MUQ26_07140, partial [Armatimonadetes bacterium]|nr:hypothetical protein [Armatimonadota bacterium]
MQALQRPGLRACLRRAGARAGRVGARGHESVAGVGEERWLISYLEGKLLDKSEDRIVVLAGGVGYEVLLPRAVMPALRSRQA